MDHFVYFKKYHCMYMCIYSMYIYMITQAKKWISLYAQIGEGQAPINEQSDTGDHGFKSNMIKHSSG